MATKKQQLEFNASVEELLTKWGAVCQPYAGGVRWLVMTKAGTLYITLDKPEGSRVFSVYCRFDDAAKAKAVLRSEELHRFVGERLNPYSGKWNFHFFTAQQCLVNFRDEMQMILVNQNIHQ